MGGSLNDMGISDYFTRTIQVALLPPRLTVILVVPFFTPVTVPEALTVAMEGSALV